MNVTLASGPLPPSPGPSKSSTSAPKPTDPAGIFDGPRSKSRPSLFVGCYILHLFVPTSHMRPKSGLQTVELIKHTERVQRRASKYILDLPFFCDINYNHCLSTLNLLPLCYWHEYLQSWTEVVVTPTPSPRIQCCHMKSQFNIDLGGGVLQHFCPRL